jgi:Arc/MetJ-type ribon-helix-helix transcriptional regulator
VVDVSSVLYDGKARSYVMKSLQVELPDRLAAELDALVQAGWFHSSDELVRLALAEYLRRHRFELLEQFQLEDIEWALRHKRATE